MATCEESFSTASRVTISVVLIVLILITIAGNVIVCLAVGLNRRLRTLTNCFIVSLAITDLLLGLLVLPFSAIYQLSCAWTFGQIFCNIYTSLDVMLCTASILNLFMISLDRYCAVTDPLRYPVLVTPIRVAISLVFIWVISITLSFLAIHLGWNSRNRTTSDNQNISDCKVQVNEVYGLVDGLVTFYLPLLIMCITYYRIFKIARDQAKRINHISSWNAATIKEHKATVTLAVVMGAFIICWFPYFTVFVYRGLKGDEAINEVIEAIVLWLGYANSALNPILYAALNRDFRTAYQELFCCRPTGHHSQDAFLRPSNSQMSRSQDREHKRQEEKPLKLQVWCGNEVTAPQGTTDRVGFLLLFCWAYAWKTWVSSHTIPCGHPTVDTAYQGHPRKPALLCTPCSSNLLSCCKNLWGLKFLQRHLGAPEEELSGETLSEGSLRTPPSKAVSMLLPETRRTPSCRAL